MIDFNANFIGPLEVFTANKSLHKLSTRKVFLSLGNKKKSHGAKSGEYEQPFPASESLEQQAPRAMTHCHIAI